MLHIGVFVWTAAFISLGCICRSRIAGSYCYMTQQFSNLLRNCQTGFQSGYSILHSHQQKMRIPIPPHPHQHLLLSVFYIVAILVGVKCSLRICPLFFSQPGCTQRAMILRYIMLLTILRPMSFLTKYYFYQTLKSPPLHLKINQEDAAPSDLVSPVVPRPDPCNYGVGAGSSRDTTSCVSHPSL